MVEGGVHEADPEGGHPGAERSRPEVGRLGAESGEPEGFDEVPKPREHQDECHAKSHQATFNQCGEVEVVGVANGE